MQAANKTVAGINGAIVDTTDPSCLNRFLTEVEWDENALNERRLQLLQRDSDTRFSQQGLIAIDDTLIDHDGKCIKNVGWFWDHAQDRHKITNHIHSKKERDGKQEFGMGDRQLRYGQGQTRHM